MRPPLDTMLAGLEPDHRERVAACVSAELEFRLRDWPTYQELLVERVQAGLGPAGLLCLASGLPAEEWRIMLSALLLHPQAHIREQTLDALTDLDAADRALRRLCKTLSHRAMLAASLLDSAAKDGNSAPEQTRSHLSLTEALQAGDAASAIAILARRTGLDIGAIETAIRLQDARILVCLCWKAGCNPAETASVEMQLARLAPDQLLLVGPEPRWPIAEASMRWSLAVLQEMQLHQADCS